jgi:hypothetical protein
LPGYEQLLHCGVSESSRRRLNTNIPAAKSAPGRESPIGRRLLQQDSEARVFDAAEPAEPGGGGLAVRGRGAALGIEKEGRETAALRRLSPGICSN